MVYMAMTSLFPLYTMEEEAEHDSLKGKKRKFTYIDLDAFVGI